MRVYPKDHSHKRYKIVTHSSLYRTQVSYTRTLLMARLVAFTSYHSSQYMLSVDILDQMEGDGD